MKDFIVKTLKHYKPEEGIDKSIFTNPTIYEANSQGCENCMGQGYTGRVGVYEVLEMHEDLRKMILDGVAGFQIEKALKEKGMITLDQDALVKVLQGITSLAEMATILKK